ncbi:MAG: AAA family ATPase, partial [Patescibacteria group bacterium]
LLERSQIQKELGRLEAKLEFLAMPKTSSKSTLGWKNEDLLGLINEIKEILGDCFQPKADPLLAETRSDFEDLKKIINELVEKIDKFLNKELTPHNSTNNSVEVAGQADLENFKNNLEAKLNIIEMESKKLEEQEMKITIGLEEFNKKFQKAFELMELKRKELRELDGNKNRILFEGEKLNLKFQDLEDQLRQIGKSIKELPITNYQLPITAEEFSEIERKMFKLRTELAAIGEIDESLIKEAQEVETHYNFLTSQSQDLEKAIIDLKNLIKELSEKIHFEFNASLKSINDEFNKFFKLMFGGGFAKLIVKREERKVKNNNDDEISEEKDVNEENNKDENEKFVGVDIDLNLPKKRITSLEMLSGGEKSLVSIAALFALISISPPPFLVLDEIDAALDENNSGRFADLIKEFSKKTQFIVVTHNRAVMEAANALYGITVGEDGTSKILSLKLDTKI